MKNIPLVDVYVGRLGTDFQAIPLSPLIVIAMNVNQHPELLILP